MVTANAEANSQNAAGRESRRAGLATATEGSRQSTHGRSAARVTVPGRAPTGPVARSSDGGSSLLPMPLLRLLALLALHGLLHGLPQPILVGYGQIAPDELHGLAFERVHDGIDLAVRTQHDHRRCARPQVASHGLDHGTVDHRGLQPSDQGRDLVPLLLMR